MPYADREEQKRFQREWRSARRAQWIADRGGACVECGSTERIEIDHIDPGEKECNPTFAWSRVDRDEELDKCQLLCHECHAKKTYVRREAEHGTRLSYQRRGCRCEACTAWNRARVQRQRANKYQRRSSAA
jgi:hypothetical protein